MYTGYPLLEGVVMLQHHGSVVEIRSVGPTEMSVGTVLLITSRDDAFTCCAGNDVTVAARHFRPLRSVQNGGQHIFVLSCLVLSWY